MNNRRAHNGDQAHKLACRGRGEKPEYIYCLSYVNTMVKAHSKIAARGGRYAVFVKSQFSAYSQPCRKRHRRSFGFSCQESSNRILGSILEFSPDL